ncbi:MAG: IS110 family transposase [Halothiobacillaceae bacterium]|nr:IS110 family transposase [Halothiobacillaceae bacterium]
MTLPYRYVGCDVSKHWLDVFDPAEGVPRRIANTAEATSALAGQLASSRAFLVFEATGAYDSTLRTALHQAGVPCARLNPTLVRRYAQARGRKAKTDALDAVVLADLGERLRPDPDPVPCPHRARLAALATRRDQLVTMRAMEKNRIAEAEDPLVRQDIEATIAYFDAAISRLEAEIQRHIQSHDSLRRQARLLTSAPGIGPVAAQVLLALMPELGHTNPKRLAALAGLAPFNHDSGQLKGKRCISGGRARVRKALYMAALMAARTCPNLKAFADRITQSAKARKVALIAVARKLLIRLNAMLRDEAIYQAP